MTGWLCYYYNDLLNIIHPNKIKDFTFKWIYLFKCVLLEKVVEVSIKSIT